MIKEEKYMREAGVWNCEQRSQHHVYSVGKHTEAVVR